MDGIRTRGLMAAYDLPLSCPTTRNLGPYGCKPYDLTLSYPTIRNPGSHAQQSTTELSLDIISIMPDCGKQ